jgi:uncharacterized protein (DUF3820 family)
MVKQKDIPFTFGKYRDILIADIPNKYLTWIVGEKWFRDKFVDLYEQAIIEIKYRKDFDITIEEENKK